MTGRLGPVHLYAAAAPGVGHAGAKRELDLRLALVLGPVVLKTSTVVALR